jgi:hypothetical protein
MVTQEEDHQKDEGGGDLADGCILEAPAPVGPGVLFGVELELEARSPSRVLQVGEEIHEGHNRKKGHCEAVEAAESKAQKATSHGSNGRRVHVEVPAHGEVLEEAAIPPAVRQEYVYLLARLGKIKRCLRPGGAPSEHAARVHADPRGRDRAKDLGVHLTTGGRRHIPRCVRCGPRCSLPSTPALGRPKRRE